MVRIENLLLPSLPIHLLYVSPRPHCLSPKATASFLLYDEKHVKNPALPRPRWSCALARHSSPRRPNSTMYCTSLSLDQLKNPRLTTICQAPCFATIINDACGNPNDWACGCASNKVSDYNTACATALLICTIPETQGTGCRRPGFPLCPSPFLSLSFLHLTVHLASSFICFFPPEMVSLVSQICGLEAHASGTGAAIAGSPSATLPGGGGGGPAAGLHTPTGTTMPQSSISAIAPTPASSGGSQSQQGTTTHSSASLSLGSIMGAAWLAIGAGWVLVIVAAI